jgi:SPP1 gp7 family putative phage head morphogenesis protein
MRETRALSVAQAPATISRKKLEAMAPKEPTTALTFYSAAMETYYERVTRLVEKHVLSRLPVAGSGDELDRTALRLGLGALQIDMLALAEKTRSPARTAARRAGSSAAREVGRLLNTKIPKDDRQAALEDGFAQRNVELVRRIAGDQVRAIEKAIDEYVEGTSLRAAILDSTHVARNRANLIGRDQVHKHQDQQISFWSVELGSEAYVYVDKRDERVRRSHREHYGKIFRWSSPPSTGHPGTEPGCRCKPVPIEAFFGTATL